MPNSLVGGDDPVPWEGPEHRCLALCWGEAAGLAYQNNICFHLSKRRKFSQSAYLFIRLVTWKCLACFIFSPLKSTFNFERKHLSWHGEHSLGYVLHHSARWSSKIFSHNFYTLQKKGKISNGFIPMCWFGTSQWLNPLLAVRVPGAARSGGHLSVTWVMQFTTSGSCFWQIFYLNEV